MSLELKTRRKITINDGKTVHGHVGVEEFIQKYRSSIEGKFEVQRIQASLILNML